jgi:hypothetical protein
MTLSARLTKAELGLSDALMWSEAVRLAQELGERPEVIHRQAQTFIDKYWHLARPGAGGVIDAEPVLRAMAEGEGLEYDELVVETKRLLRRQRARAKRRSR